jgi:hypothetical protein
MLLCAPVVVVRLLLAPQVLRVGSPYYAARTWMSGILSS